MKFLTALPLLAMLAVAGPFAVHAEDGNKDNNPEAAQQDEWIPKEKAAAFDKRVFGGPVGDKASACFVRRYDAAHLRQHPKQKVSQMKLLVSAETKPGEQASYAYKIGVQFRNKPGDFDGGSFCSHYADDDGKNIRFSCDVECGGGGIEVALSKDDKAVIVHLEAIALWNRKHPDGDSDSLQGGADDKVFRLERVDAKECADLIGHQEVASTEQ
jgi:hypothetical protein